MDPHKFTPVHVSILSVAPAPQQASPLFAVLPPEIRAQIFELALADFPDPANERRYAADTHYTRPSYSAPRRTDARLVRVCRAVYRETWFLPFVLREQTHWLTGRDRAPPDYDHRAAVARVAQTVQHIANQQHGGDRSALEIANVRVFAQMYMLEANQLTTLLRQSQLRPRRLTLTIRHADWWWWERDEPLRFEGGWIAHLADFAALPASVRELHIELESLERKAAQVDAIARQMAERWAFTRFDGVALFVDCAKAPPVSRWTAPNAWLGSRGSSREVRLGGLDYYLVDVVFRPRNVVERRSGGRISPLALKHAESLSRCQPDDLRLKWQGDSGDKGPR